MPNAITAKTFTDKSTNKQTNKQKTLNLATANSFFCFLSTFKQVHKNVGKKKSFILASNGTTRKKMVLETKQKCKELKKKHTDYHSHTHTLIDSSHLDTLTFFTDVQRGFGNM